MKKLTAIILIMTVVFGLAGCAGNADKVEFENHNFISGY